MTRNLLEDGIGAVDAHHWLTLIGLFGLGLVASFWHGGRKLRRLVDGSDNIADREWERFRAVMERENGDA